MKFAGLTLIFAALTFAQAPSPVQTGVTPNPNGTEPIFRVDVTSKTVRAVNYHNRQGTTHIDFRGTALMPEARGEASVTANTGATRVSLKFDHLSNPAQFGPEYLTYVLWAITPEGRAERLGEVTLKDPNSKTAGLYATTDLQSYGMIVTAEPYFSVSQPSDVVVMENFLRKDTSGTLEIIDAKYELLKRGQYTMNISGGALAPITSDLRIPLQLREAREAIAIAKAQGADRYAPDVMAKIAVNMQNAEGFDISKNQKELDTVAREATQQAEDARRISIVKEREEADLAAKRREEDARRQAATASAEAAEQARLRAAADAERADAERQKHEAEIATAKALSAQQDAEQARLAALAEQKRLADQASAAQAARAAAEKDTLALREKLREQLNSILQTRDTARGLIVSLSDVLFDFDQASLKPGAREKLAKVSGILLAYPTLHMNVEGHTDSVGSDDYNLKLSQRRADAVRDYLTTNGINAANIQAVGLGKDGPVASNDTAAGRQQNRRVEMVVSGDVIGQPIQGTTSSLQ
ncbi:MAG TPA: OmpA family protein [Bryobacteraceae bacterium]|jgi:outer membrane protein OmpA-like peptidoglycan-associated protein